MADWRLKKRCASMEIAVRQNGCDIWNAAVCVGIEHRRIATGRIPTERGLLCQMKAGQPLPSSLNLYSRATALIQSRSARIIQHAILCAQQPRKLLTIAAIADNVIPLPRPGLLNPTRNGFASAGIRQVIVDSCHEFSHQPARCDSRHTFRAQLAIRAGSFHLTISIMVSLRRQWMHALRWLELGSGAERLLCADAISKLPVRYQPNDCQSASRPNFSHSTGRCEIPKDAIHSGGHQGQHVRRSLACSRLGESPCEW